jgi:hypothetical protein
MASKLSVVRKIVVCHALPEKLLEILTLDEKLAYKNCEFKTRVNQD